MSSACNLNCEPLTQVGCLDPAAHSLQPWNRRQHPHHFLLRLQTACRLHALPPVTAAQLQRYFAALGPLPELPQGLERPSGPSTAATGSTSGLGKFKFGGFKADYVEKYPQG